MKKLILASILSLASLTAHAYPANTSFPGDYAFLSNLEILKLNTVENSTLIITTGYPGAISHNCSLVMRTQNNKSMETFMSRVDVSLIAAFNPKPEVKGSIIWPLSQGGYLGGIKIITKDGKSIASNVALSFPGNEGNESPTEIGLYADVCHKTPKA